MIFKNRKTMDNKTSFESRVKPTQEILKTPENILKEYFGYDDFRQGQKEIINAILENKDAMAIMPTGAGKSICFQIPSMILEGITIVISPLISLMQDQVTSLVQAGIPAAYINGNLSEKQIDLVFKRALGGSYKIIYVAPERLSSERFLKFAQMIDVSMVTIDEAHCISQWGQDFRPTYLDIPVFIKSLKNRPIVSAFTATATKRVAKEIVELLNLKSPKEVCLSFDRKNLYFETIKNSDRKFNNLIKVLEDNKNVNAIVYCLTRKTVESVGKKLSQMGYATTIYHAGLPTQERFSNQNDFIFDRKNIMVATCAFGMGIDKSNISLIVHYNMPQDIESYYQEAGRAGRDGNNAKCILIYNESDVFDNRFMIGNSNENIASNELDDFHDAAYERLDKIVSYSKTSTCLRAFILNYFGEETEGECGNCSNCNSEYSSENVANEAEVIIRCVMSLNQRFGTRVVTDVVCGNVSKTVSKFGLNENKYFNALPKENLRVKEIISLLIENKYLKNQAGKFPVLQLTSKSQEFLLEKPQTLEIKYKIDVKEEYINKLEPDDNTYLELLEVIKAKRFEISRVKNLAPYQIISDYTMQQIAKNMPVDRDTLRSVSGIGRYKLENYGDAIITAVREFCNKKGIEPYNKFSVRDRNAYRNSWRSNSDNKNKNWIYATNEIISKMIASEEFLSVSEISRVCNSIAIEFAIDKITAPKINLWLISQDIVKEEFDIDNKTVKVPTQLGFDLGLKQKEVVTSYGKVYYKTVFPKPVQQLIFNNYNNILNMQ